MHVVYRKDAPGQCFRSVALADKLGAEPVPFPGDHMGYGSHAAAFAETLHQAFTSE